MLTEEKRSRDTDLLMAPSDQVKDPTLILRSSKEPAISTELKETHLFTLKLQTTMMVGMVILTEVLPKKEIPSTKIRNKTGVRSSQMVVAGEESESDLLQTQ